MIITCPYCKRKMKVSPWQLFLKGRKNVVCPVCHRKVYEAVQKTLQTVQTVVAVLALIVFFILWNLDSISEAMLPWLLVIGMLAVMIINELVCYWVTRDSALQARTEAAMEAERQRTAERKAANKERRQQHQHKKKK